MGRFDPKIDFQRDPYLLTPHAEYHNTQAAILETILHLVDSIGVVGCLSNRFRLRTSERTSQRLMICPTISNCSPYITKHIRHSTGHDYAKIVIWNDVLILHELACTETSRRAPDDRRPASDSLATVSPGTQCDKLCQQYGFSYRLWNYGYDFPY